MKWRIVIGQGAGSGGSTENWQTFFHCWAWELGFDN
jgi:hypothetical protein